MDVTQCAKNIFSLFVFIHNAYNNHTLFQNSQGGLHTLLPCAWLVVKVFDAIPICTLPASIFHLWGMNTKDDLLAKSSTLVFYA
jgi:hypothetical protein